MENIIYKAFNPITRKMETIYLFEAEIVEGLKLIKMYWCEAIGKYVTIPGDALFRINVDLDLEHCADDK